MTKYRVEFSSQAYKTLKKMDKPTATALVNWIEKNLEGTENPWRIGKPLKGNLQGIWRYRIGDNRILAEIGETEIVIFIIGIGHRKEIYK